MMDEILKKILDIDKDNQFLEYIVHRMTRNDYRGTHKSQHQRYDLDKALLVLKNIYNLVGENKMPIPRGDWSMNNKEKMKELKEKFPLYYKLVNATGIGANSIKKHLFVDFSRAGFLKKYDKYGEEVEDTKKRTSYDEIALTKTAVEMLETKDVALRYRIFTRGIEELLGDSLIDLIQAIDLSEYRRGNFAFEEYTLIFSDDENLDGNEKIELLGEYRRLSSQDKDKALRLIKEYCNPKRFKGDKTTKRDYHNWQNETQQLFSLFKTTIYFEVFKVGNKRFFKLNTSENIGIFELTRSEEPKKMYFDKHKVPKTDNYELHHIVPLSFVRNKEEYKIVDDYKNLIYLHKNKHKQIKRDFIIFRDQKPKIFFENRFNFKERVVAKNNEDSKFNEDLLPIIKKYNKALRKSLFN